MTLDERLAELAEADRRIQDRHEALAETVELLMGMQRESERLFQENNRANRQQFELIRGNFEVVLDSIKRLENIALAHEERLDDLEGT